MKTEKLLRFIGEIPDVYVNEAAPKEKSTHQYTWIKWCVSAAACLAIVLAAVYAFPFYHNIISPSQSNAAPSGTGVSVHLNNLSGEPSGTTGMFALLSKDFQAMTTGELFRYYGITLPIEDAVPSLKLQPRNDGGIYQSTGRGVYYDANTFLFETSDSSRSLSITLAKACKFISGVQKEFVSGQSLTFTELNGRKIALFHYTDEDGNDCCYVEFVQGDMAYYVTASNLPQDDFIKGLSALLEANSSGNIGDTHMLAGTINAIDSYANTLGVTLDDGQEYENVTVYLPEGETAKYTLNEKVSVSYTGEPATVDCIWQQQLISVKAIEK